MTRVRTIHSGKITGLFILAVLFLCVPPALAQPRAEKTVTNDTRPAREDPSSGLKRARDLFSEGLSAYRNNNLDRAIRKFQEAVKSDSENQAAHFNLGSVFYEKNQLDSATVHYRRAVALDPSDANAHYYLGLCYLDLNKTIDARVHFQKALNLDPSMKKARRRLKQIPPVAVREKTDTAPSSSRFAAKSNFLLGVYYPGMSLGYQTPGLTTEARFASLNDIQILSLRFKNHLWRYSGKDTIYWGTELGQVWFEGTSAEGTGQILSGFSGVRIHFLPFLSLHLDMGPQVTRLRDSETALSTTGMDFIINSGITLHFFGDQQ